MNKTASSPSEHHIPNYFQFLRKMAFLATEGNWMFYAWMTFLSGIALVGLHAWGIQVREGMIVTHMSDLIGLKV